MRNLFFVLVFLFFSCNHNHKTTATTISESNLPVTKSAPPTLLKINTPIDDPNFVLPIDTISKFGPHSITRNILQENFDSFGNGNLWFATWEGIVSYDGKLFTNHTLKEGLKHYHVFSILQERSNSYREGNIWFGTIGGGVYQYNPSASSSIDKNSFTLFTTKDGLVNDVVLCMMEDKKGNIWFGTDNGVSRFKENKFYNYTTKDGLSDNSVNCITQDKTGKIWFGTRGGISWYDPTQTHLPGTKSFTNFTIDENLSFHNVRCILEDNSKSIRNGNIWIGSQEGLSIYDPTVIPKNGSKSIINYSTVFTSYIFQDKTGKIWLSGNKINGRGMTLSRYDPAITINPKQLSTIEIISNDMQIFGLTEDRKGNIWFGMANGACRYNPSAVLITGEKSFTYFSENVAKQ